MDLHALEGLVTLNMIQKFGHYNWVTFQRNGFSMLARTYLEKNSGRMMILLCVEPVLMYEPNFQNRLIDEFAISGLGEDVNESLKEASNRVVVEVDELIDKECAMCSIQESMYAIVMR